MRSGKAATSFLKLDQWPKDWMLAASDPWMDYHLNHDA
jgi:hypothetical protein